MNVQHDAVSFVYSKRDAQNVSVKTEENAIAAQLSATIGGQHVPLRDQVLIALRQAIVNGELPAG